MTFHYECAGKCELNGMEEKTKQKKLKAFYCGPEFFLSPGLPYKLKVYCAPYNKIACKILHCNKFSFRNTYSIELVRGFY